MKTYKNLYPKIYDLDNLTLAYKKARKGKTKNPDIIKFEKNLERNLLDLQFELKSQFYKPLPLITFSITDPKTRLISKSDFRDRVVHHALCNIIEPIFDKTFIYDSCANRKGKGTLHALRRFEKFARKATKNFTTKGYCLKADIRHYFNEVDHEILIQIINKKIKDTKTIWLVRIIIKNTSGQKGMPLGNLTSQFFANVYLNELDYFVKYILRVKYYIRYVDDFVILDFSEENLPIPEIEYFLIKDLKLELHKEKSRIINLSNGIDFVGFRNFYHFRLVRKRSVLNMFTKVSEYHKGIMPKEKVLETFQGWQAHAKWANTFKLKKDIVRKIYSKR